MPIFKDGLARAAQNFYEEGVASLKKEQNFSITDMRAQLRTLNNALEKAHNDLIRKNRSFATWKANNSKKISDIRAQRANLAIEISELSNVIARQQATVDAADSLLSKLQAELNEKNKSILKEQGEVKKFKEEKKALGEELIAEIHKIQPVNNEKILDSLKSFASRVFGANTENSDLDPAQRNMLELLRSFVDKFIKDAVYIDVSSAFNSLQAKLSSLEKTVEAVNITVKSHEKQVIDKDDQIRKLQIEKSLKESEHNNFQNVHPIIYLIFSIIIDLYFSTRSLEKSIEIAKAAKDIAKRQLERLTSELDENTQTVEILTKQLRYLEVEGEILSRESELASLTKEANSLDHEIEKQSLANQALTNEKDANVKIKEAKVKQHSDLGSKLNEIDDQKNTKQSEISSLESKIQEIETDITNLQARIEQQEIVKQDSKDADGTSAASTDIENLASNSHSASPTIESDDTEGSNTSNRSDFSQARIEQREMIAPAESTDSAEAKTDTETLASVDTTGSDTSNSSDFSQATSKNDSVSSDEEERLATSDITKNSKASHSFFSRNAPSRYGFSRVSKLLLKLNQHLEGYMNNASNFYGGIYHAKHSLTAINHHQQEANGQFTQALMLLVNNLIIAQRSNNMIKALSGEQRKLIRAFSANLNTFSMNIELNNLSSVVSAFENVQTSIEGIIQLMNNDPQFAAALTSTGINFDDLHTQVVAFTKFKVMTLLPDLGPLYADYMVAMGSENLGFVPIYAAYCNLKEKLSYYADNDSALSRFARFMLDDFKRANNDLITSKISKTRDSFNALFPRSYSYGKIKKNLQAIYSVYNSEENVSASKCKEYFMDINNIFTTIKRDNPQLITQNNKLFHELLSLGSANIFAYFKSLGEMSKYDVEIELLEEAIHNFELSSSALIFDERVTLNSIITDRLTENMSKSLEDVRVSISELRSKIQRENNFFQEEKEFPSENEQLLDILSGSISSQVEMLNLSEPPRDTYNLTT